MCARRRGLFCLARVDDGACPEEDLGHFARDPFDRVERHGCAQGQFDHWDAARDQCAGDRYGVLDVVDHDDGYDGDTVEQ